MPAARSPAVNIDAARSRAWAKADKEAEADWQHALGWTSDPRLLDNIRVSLGQNRETHFKDADGALTAYRAVIQGAKQLGTSDQFYAVMGIARILSERRQFDEALSALHRADIDKLRGYWHGSLLMAEGDTLLAAGRKDKALASYKAVTTDEAVDARMRKMAEEKMGALAK